MLTYFSAIAAGLKKPISPTFGGDLTWIFKYSEQAIAIAKTIFSNILAAPPALTYCDLLDLALSPNYVTSHFQNCTYSHGNTILHHLNWQFPVNLNLSFMFEQKIESVGMCGG
jgi:hypothetical protein